MKLTEPIDQYVLRILSDGEQYNPIRVWYLAHTEYLDIEPDENPDSARWGVDYIGQRMGILRSYELLERLAPESRSGLYVITDLGRAALEHHVETGEAEFSYSVLLERLNGSEE